MNIIGQGFSLDSFKDYIESVSMSAWLPQFIVVHNTSSPTQSLYRSWHDRKGWTGEQWMRNLASYYSGLGWSGGPHLFVAYDKIWVFNPLNKRGTHSPSWNSVSWGVETVGEFEVEAFDQATHDNLVGALGEMHLKLGLDPGDYKRGVRGLHFHKEDPKTTHRTCPGKKIVKTALVRDVSSYMKGNDLGGHDHVPEEVHVAPTSEMTDEELTSVKWLQAGLNKWKPSLKLAIDGISGPATKSAIRLFQSQNSLAVDGIAGPVTRTALKKVTAGAKA